MTLRIWIPHKPQKTYFSQTIAPSEVYSFLLKNSLSRWNFLDIFHLNDQFRPMKIAPHSLICHWNEVSKFSVVSVFSFWLYGSEWKPGNAGNFGIFENFEFCLSSPQKLDLNMTYKWLQEFEFHINPKKPTFRKLLLQVTLIVSYKRIICPDRTFWTFFI